MTERKHLVWRDNSFGEEIKKETYNNMPLQQFLVNLHIDLQPDEIILDDIWHPVPFSDLKWNYIGSRTLKGTLITFRSLKTQEVEVYREVPEVPVDPEELKIWEEKNSERLVNERHETQKIHELHLGHNTKEWNEDLRDVQAAESYLNVKGVKPFGVKFRASQLWAKNDDVIVPARDMDGKIWNLVTLFPDGSKTQRPTRMKGLFHLIGGNPTNFLYFAEGYTTAASIYEATNRPTVCCFSVGNLKEVASQFRKKYPHTRFIFCADDDKKTEINYGVNGAKECVRLFGDIFVTPFFQSKDKELTDFNDLHRLEGLDILKMQLMGRAVESRGEFNPISFQDLKSEPEKSVTFVVEDLLPTTGVSLVFGVPKVGKTTIIKQLITEIVNGGSFLGRKCAKKKVFYITLEDKRPSVIQKFNLLNVQDHNLLELSFDSPSKDYVNKLEFLITKNEYKFIVIDTLFRFIKNISDGNSYAEMQQVLSPFDSLAKQLGVHIMLVHHAKKGSTGESGSGLGSQAIEGLGDTILNVFKEKIEGSMKVLVSSVGRDGKDIPKTIIHYDKGTGAISSGGAVFENKKNSLKDKILYIFKTNGNDWIAPKDIKEQTGGTYENVKNGCFELNREGALLFSKGDRGGVLYKANPEYVAPLVEDESEF